MSFCHVNPVGENCFYCNPPQNEHCCVNLLNPGHCLFPENPEANKEIRRLIMLAYPDGKKPNDREPH